MALVNMARTKQEVKTEQEGWKEAENAPKYPYGLSLHLDNETIKKLGIAIPEGGAQLHIEAIAKVTSVSSHEEVDGDKRCNLQLQITDMTVTPEQGAAKSDMAKKLYE